MLIKYGYLPIVCAIGIYTNITICAGYIAGTGRCREYTKHFQSINVLPAEKKDCVLLTIDCEIAQAIER